MSQHTRIVEKWIDHINRQAIHELHNVFAEDGYVTYGGGGMGEAHGPEAIGKLLGHFYEGFPDLDSQIEELFDADGGRVVGRFLSRATHTGPFMGIEPTGKKIAINGIAIYRFKGDRIAHEWNMDDLLGLLQQIGAAPIPG